MQRFVILISFLFSVHLYFGQYEYFNNGYTFQEGQNEITTNVFVLDDGYVSFHLTGTDEGQKFMFRIVDIEGLVLTEDTVGFEQFNSFLIQRTGSIVHSENGFVWGGDVSGPDASGAMAARFNDLTFEKEWEIFFQGDTLTWKAFHSMALLSNGNYIFGGAVHRDVDNDVWYEYSDLFLVKLNDSGDTIWTQEIPLEEDSFVHISQVFELENADLVLFGGIYEDWDNVIYYLNGEGELLWTYSWGEDGLDDWTPRGVQEGNGEFTLAYKKAMSIYSEGSSITYGKPHLRQFNMQDTSIIGFGDIEYDHEMIECHIYDIVKTPDQGYAIVGTSALNVGTYHYYGWILKTDSLGEELWFKTYYHLPSPQEDFIFDRLYDIEVTLDGGLIVAGYHTTPNEQKSWLLKLDACGDVEYSDCPFTIDVKEYNSLATEMSIYPNPACEQLAISFPQSTSEALNLRIYNSIGELIYSFQLSSGIRQEEIELSHFSEGIYILQLLNSGGELVGSEVFEKM